MTYLSFSHFIAVCEGVLAPNKSPAAGLPRFNVTGRTNAERKRLKVDPVPVRPLGSVVHQVVPGHLIPRKPMVFLSDGQEGLWAARARWLPSHAVDILDVLHVTPRLWAAAHVFHAEGSSEAEDFARERLGQILRGKVTRVVRDLRKRAGEPGTAGPKKKTIEKVCGYLHANRKRMRYDEYLRDGYPIATGVVEGACRHLVKDRMERAGMHWTVPGAQAMLDLRSVYVSAVWDEYQDHRIKSETQRLYPHRDVLKQSYTLAA